MYSIFLIHAYFPQTHTALGVLAVFLEDQFLATGQKSVRGNWPLWPPGGLPQPSKLKIGRDGGLILQFRMLLAFIISMIYQRSNLAAAAAEFEMCKFSIIFKYPNRKLAATAGNLNIVNLASCQSVQCVSKNVNTYI